MSYGTHMKLNMFVTGMARTVHDRKWFDVKLRAELSTHGQRKYVEGEILMTGSICVDGSRPFKTSMRSMACVHSALAHLHMMNGEGVLRSTRAV